MDGAPVFASAGEAAEVACAALGYLTAADAAGLSAEEQAGCLQRLERVSSVVAAARASVLGAFTAGKGYSADADYSPRAWLIHKTGITRAAAVSYTAWARRAVAHPEVFAVLAAGDVSESFARTVCVWTDKLPLASRDKADAILMGPAASRPGSPVAICQTASPAGIAPVRMAGGGRTGTACRIAAVMRCPRTGRCGCWSPSAGPGCCTGT